MTFLTERTKPKTISIVSILALLVFLPLMLLAVENIAALITRASGTPANIMVNVKNVLTNETIDTNFYHAFAQGGEQSGDMLSPVVGSITALHPRVIRLDHLYDNYGVSVGGDGTVTGWGTLDAAVSSILATGARPVLALSYMPSAIAQGGSIINPPNDWNTWARVVQQTIEHFSGKGNRNLGGVYYEVWNEPDSPQFGGWSLSGSKNYLTLYHWSSVGAGNAQNVNYFYLGGPATTGLFQSWTLALVQSGNRINFLSWHTYQQDPAYYDRDQRSLIQWLLPYPSYTLIPTLITEFGFTGAKSTLYGTQYAAAHAIAVIRQLITGSPTYLFSFEPVDGPNEQSTKDGWGLITNPDNGMTKKPRYWVYNFMDAMAGTRVAISGEGTWVTGFASTQNNVLKVLLVNFNGFTENVPVTFQNIDAGTYNLKTSYLFGPTTTVSVSVPAAPYQTKVPLTANNSVILTLTKTP